MWHFPSDKQKPDQQQGNTSSPASKLSLRPVQPMNLVAGPTVAQLFLKFRDSLLNSEESIREWIALSGAPEEKNLGLESGAAEGTRTPDPIITNDVLYHLSYSGVLRQMPGIARFGADTQVKPECAANYRSLASDARA